MICMQNRPAYLWKKADLATLVMADKTERNSLRKVPEISGDGQSCEQGLSVWLWN